MRFLPLLWGNLMRKKLRTAFTLLSILVAFLLYGYLSAINVAFEMGVDVAGADRLITIDKVSIIQLLPVSYQDRILEVEGVDQVVHATWFGGIYQEASNFFPQMPVEPERYLDIYPEFLLPEDQKKAWLEDRTGAIVGRATADRFGWKVGDRIPLQPTIWRQSGGDQAWEFDLVGIYDGAEKGTDTTQFLFHYDYFDEARAFGQGMVGWYVVRVKDPEQAVAVAERIDRLFQNSPSETKTATEQVFAQAFANQLGNIGMIITAVLSAVFFTILLVAGNTMAQSVREKTGELAVLKTLGFSMRQVVGFVLAESMALAILGGGTGLILAWALIAGGDPTGGFLPVFYFPVPDLLMGVGWMALLGLATGLVPSVQAVRLRIVDALRRV